MKKNYTRTVIFTITALLATTLSFAQVNPFSKIEDLKDMKQKTLMVVLENNPLTDASIREAVTNIWDLSKYEFCNLEEFEKIKTNPSYYFLLRVKGIFKKESDPGIEFLTLVKGGKEAVMGVDKMYEVLALPFQPVGDGNNYILPFIDTYIKIFKTHVERVQEKKIAATMGISWYSNSLSKIRSRVVMFNENDLSGLLDKDEVEEILNNNGSVADEDKIEQIMANKTQDVLVSICIAPLEPQTGSYCYKMLVGADNGELYYYRKQKITKKNPKGFLPDDVKKISIPFIF